ncbi:MAG: hypothetical protein JXD21_03400 [Candidatus Omnitrophica bacterium]|nr:hypothetical protein [Candidatus Omnitrophota bacterium]
MKKQIYLILIGIFLLSGCSLIKNKGPLLTLKSIGDSQRQIGKYIEKQKGLFTLLVDDIKNDELPKNLTEAQITSRYGAPVVVTELDRTKRRLLYRYPKKYYTSDRVYFYIDDGIMTRWEYIPYKNELVSN